MQTTPATSTMIHWAITFALLAFVTAGFSFTGTASEYLSLLARVLAAVFLGMAILVMFIRPRPPGTR